MLDLAPFLPDLADPLLFSLAAALPPHGGLLIQTGPPRHCLPSGKGGSAVQRWAPRLEAHVTWPQAESSSVISAFPSGQAPARVPPPIPHTWVLNHVECWESVWWQHFWWQV